MARNLIADECIFGEHEVCFSLVVQLADPLSRVFGAVGYLREPDLPSCKGGELVFLYGGIHDTEGNHGIHLLGIVNECFFVILLGFGR